VFVEWRNPTFEYSEKQAPEKEEMKNHVVK
jgi:hypothetical protein